MARLNRILRSNTISFANKLYKALVTSILLYCCETWKGFRDQVPEKLLRSFCSELQTKGWVRSKINFLVGPPAVVKIRELAWFRYITRYDSLSKTIPRSTLEGGRSRGRQRKCWTDGVKEWTSVPMPILLTMAFCMKEWKRISAESSPCPADDPIGQGTELKGCL